MLEFTTYPAFAARLTAPYSDPPADDGFGAPGSDGSGLPSGGAEFGSSAPPADKGDDPPAPGGGAEKGSSSPPKDKKKAPAKKKPAKPKPKPKAKPKPKPNPKATAAKKSKPAASGGKVIPPRKYSGTSKIVFGVDHCRASTVGDYNKLIAQGVEYVAVRGYQEANGGSVDKAMFTSYKSAVAAGIKYFDVYWFPCVGPHCKGYSTQIKELVAALKDNNIENVGYIWIDFERDPKTGNFAHPKSTNQANGKKIVEAMKGIDYHWGIYSTPGEWGSIFGASFKLASNVPLWNGTWLKMGKNTPFKSGKNMFVSNNKKHGYSYDHNLAASYGGWKTAIGRQWSGSTAGGYDGDIFKVYT